MPDVLCVSCPMRVLAESARPLTKRQAELLAWLIAFSRTKGYAPSFEEIAAHYGFNSLATVHEHLTNLQHKGYLLREYKQERAMVFTAVAQEWAANHA